MGKLAILLVSVVALMLSACGSCSSELAGPDSGWQPPIDGNFETCQKVDLVVSVDPSGSMNEGTDQAPQGELGAMRDVVFPAFAEALIDIGGGLEDYRVAVLDGCPTPADFHTRGASGECNYFGGDVWMTSESSQLNTEFACVGDIYSDSDCVGENDDEQPVGAVIAALNSPFGDGANAGFLRDDALLVVVAITDEDECPDSPDCTNKSDGMADNLYAQLVSLKGDVRKLVFLGIGGGVPDGCPSNGVYGGAVAATLLDKVTDRFIEHNRGVWWDLCEGRLEDGLSEAISIIDSACREFPVD